MHCLTDGVQHLLGVEIIAEDLAIHTNVDHVERMDAVSVVYRGRGDAPDLEQTVHSFQWLHDTGLVRTELVIEDHGMAPAARRRAETLARQQAYIRWLGPTQTEQVRCEGGSTAGDDTRERVGHRLSE